MARTTLKYGCGWRRECENNSDETKTGMKQVVNRPVEYLNHGR